MNIITLYDSCIGTELINNVQSGSKVLAQRFKFDENSWTFVLERDQFTERLLVLMTIKGRHSRILNYIIGSQ